jgi:tetratricopeptide (TPR) repeat protein
MPRIAFTAKPATSRTPCRTSTGWFPKAAEARITRTCRALPIGLAALLACAPAIATVPAISVDPASAYVAARAASISGNHAQAAELYARLAAGSGDLDLQRRAISEAITAGDMPLALRLIRGAAKPAATVNSKVLLVSDALRRNKGAEAIGLLSPASGGPDLGFWVPLVQAWESAGRGDSASALAFLAAVPRGSALAPFVDEESAFVLLKARRTADADPYARRAIASAGPREYRLRLALAEGFAAAGDRQRALAVIEGASGDTSEVRQALFSGGLRTLAIDSAAKAFSDQLVALALEMQRSENPPANPLSIVQIARYAAPDSSACAILLGNLLAGDDRLAEALAAYRSVGDRDPLKGEALDSEVRALSDAKRFDEALAVANRAAVAPAARSDDFARLGDVYSSMKRYNEAAAAYGKAIALASASKAERVWPMLLLQASALESANRWPEAKAALGSAIGMAPNEPVILNFLGYAKLVHGEDLKAAEALIRRASELAPDDASITDSLGWALYKLGKVDEAIVTLQKAAIGDPSQAEIQEHLGDALYASGRRFEARFAWSAALATADGEETARLKSKIDAGLTRATAAP